MLEALGLIKWYTGYSTSDEYRDESFRQMVTFLISRSMMSSSIVFYFIESMALCNAFPAQWIAHAEGTFSIISIRNDLRNAEDNDWHRRKYLAPGDIVLRSPKRSSRMFSSSVLPFSLHSAEPNRSGFCFSFLLLDSNRYPTEPINTVKAIGNIE